MKEFMSTNRLLRPVLLAGVFLFEAGMLASCSANQTTVTSLPLSPLESEIVNTKGRSRDAASLEKESEAVRRFLMAELSLGEESNKEALEDLKVSSRLVSAPDSQIQLNLVKLYLGQGDYKAALDAASVINSDPVLIGLKAGILAALEKQEEAISAYNQVIALDPENAEALTFSACRELQQKNMQAAKEKLLSVLKTDANYLPALKLYALALIRSYENEQALIELQKVRNLDPTDEESLKLYLLSALRLNDTEAIKSELNMESKIRPNSQILSLFKQADLSAESSLQQLNLILKFENEIADKPNFAALRKAYARFALLKQDFEQAMLDLRLQLIQNPDDQEARYNLALALSSGGKPKEALQELAKFDQDNPWYVRAKSFSALLYRQMGDLASTEQAFRAALEADPGSDALQMALASILQQRAKLGEAESIYLKRLKTDPANQKVLFSYSVLLYDMGRKDQSLQVMQDVIKLNPHHADALNFLAYSLAEEGKELDRALELANRALQIEPENGFFLDTRGWVYFRMSDYKNALADLEKAVKLSKLDPEIMEHLGDLYLKLNRRKEALQTYNGALDGLIDSPVDQDKAGVERLKAKVSDLKAGK